MPQTLQFKKPFMLRPVVSSTKQFAQGKIDLAIEPPCPKTSPQFKIPATPFPAVAETPLFTNSLVTSHQDVAAQGFPIMPRIPLPARAPASRSVGQRQFHAPTKLTIPASAQEETAWALPQPLPVTPLPADLAPLIRLPSLVRDYIVAPTERERKLYSQRLSALLGNPQPLRSFDGRLVFTSIFSRKGKNLLWAYLSLCLLLNVSFILWIIWPNHLVFSSNPFVDVLFAFSLAAIVIIELIRIIQGFSLVLFALSAQDPVPHHPPSSLRVAVLTTFVPQKEPIEILEKTLRAMKAMTYAGTVDVWVLDEGNDPAVIRLAQRLGVCHFSRKDIPQFNQPSGEFKTKSKAGNHNSWRAVHEDAYDVVAQMDPDHIPFPNFLERTLGYFNDPDIAFVVAPQVYGNLEESGLTKGAAAQAFIFHGLIQRGGNGFETPLLIGTNHLYRPRAWKQIHGYQDSIIEDHLTSMTIQGAINPETGFRWKGVYTPDILSVGEGPSSWTDYFNQQKRWAYGVWEILLRHDWQLLRKLSFKQRLAYISMQLFYPSVAITWGLGGLLMLLYLVFGISSIAANSLIWALLWTASVLNQVALYFWLSKLNLAKPEKIRYGLHAMMLTLFTAPVYASAAFEVLLHKKLEYRVTAKGGLKSPDGLRTFSAHLKWFAFTSMLIVSGLIEKRAASAPFGWAVFTDCILIAPVLWFLYKNRSSRAEHSTREQDTRTLRTLQSWTPRN